MRGMAEWTVFCRKGKEIVRITCFFGARVCVRAKVVEAVGLKLRLLSVGSDTEPCLKSQLRTWKQDLT